MGWTVAVRFPTREGVFLFPTASRQALGPILDVERSGNDADRSPPSSTEIKNSGVITPFLHPVPRCDALFGKHRDNVIIKPKLLLNMLSSTSRCSQFNVKLQCTQQVRF
jgi:hypothetical protein